MSIDYSIIIPAYNEEALLENNINNLKQAMNAIPLNGEIIVTDNNSTDNTAMIAERAGARVVFEPINQISRARNTGARHANGQYLVFIDADTHVPAGTLTATLEYLQSGTCCGGGACVEIQEQCDRTTRAILAFWNFLSRNLKLAAGCYVYCSKEDYLRAGGFSEKVYASEEIWFSKALKKIGRKDKRRFKVINQPRVITSGRKLAWYSYSYQVGLMLLLMLFPFLVRSKKVCSFWYKRPGDN